MAVQRWQAKQGIVSSGSSETTGYGAVGPQTRASIFSACSSMPRVPSPPSRPSLTPPGSAPASPSPNPSPTDRSSNQPTLSCVEGVPTFEISPLKKTGSAGSTLTYTFAVKNTDENCLPREFLFFNISPLVNGEMCGVKYYHIHGAKRYPEGEVTSSNFI